MTLPIHVAFGHQGPFPHRARSARDEQIQRLEKEIACAEQKKGGITLAIESRKRSLARLKAQAVMDGPGDACSRNG